MDNTDYRALQEKLDQIAQPLKEEFKLERLEDIIYQYVDQDEMDSSILTFDGNRLISDIVSEILEKDNPGATIEVS